MTVLSDNFILANEHLVKPFRPENVQPASIDLTLDRDFRVMDSSGTRYVDLDDPESIRGLTRLVRASEKDGFILHPGEFVLASTEEKVCLGDNIMARVEGKSSLGRLGLIVHATAGFIDPGFQGPITLEMTNLLRVPIILRPGKLICQISFAWLDQPAAKPYNGRYQRQVGVTESRYGSTLEMEPAE